MTESTPETTTAAPAVTFQVIEYRRDPGGASSTEASAEMAASDAIAHIERRRAFAFSDGLEVSPLVAAPEAEAPAGDPEPAAVAEAVQPALDDVAPAEPPL